MYCPFCGGEGLYGGGAVGGWGIFLSIFMFSIPVIFLLLLVWLIYTLVKGKEGSKEGDELKIAKERYAKGKITKEEYEEILKTLKK